MQALQPGTATAVYAATLEAIAGGIPSTSQQAAKAIEQITDHMSGSCNAKCVRHMQALQLRAAKALNAAALEDIAGMCPQRHCPQHNLLRNLCIQMSCLHPIVLLSLYVTCRRFSRAQQQVLMQRLLKLLLGMCPQLHYKQHNLLRNL